MAIKILIFSGPLLLASIVSAGNVTLGGLSQEKLLFHQTFEKEPKPGVTETGIGRINIKDGVITAIDIQDLQGDGRSIVLSGGVGKSNAKIALIGERGAGFKFIIDVYGKPGDQLSKLDDSSKDTSDKSVGPKPKLDNPDESQDESEKPNEPSKDKSEKPDASKNKSEEPSKDKSEKPDEPSKDKSEKPDVSKNKSEEPSKDKSEKPDETSKGKSEEPSKDKSSDSPKLLYTPAEA